MLYGVVRYGYTSPNPIPDHTPTPTVPPTPPPSPGGVSAAATGLRPRIDTSMYDTGASAHGAGPTDEPNAPYAGGGAETYSMAPGPQLPDWQAHRTLALTLTLTLTLTLILILTLTLS